MPFSSPAMAEALIENPDAWCTPVKPALVTMVHCDDDQAPAAPSELVTLGTARAAASAMRARSSSISGVGSLAS